MTQTAFSGKFLTAQAFLMVACALSASTDSYAQADSPDLAAGENLWRYCAFCHNADGLGQARSDAPKLAGDAAWYAERQLQEPARSRLPGCRKRRWVDDQPDE